MSGDKVIEMLLNVENFSPDAAVLKFALAAQIPGSGSADSNFPAKFSFRESKFCHSNFLLILIICQQLLPTVYHLLDGVRANQIYLTLSEGRG